MNSISILLASLLCTGSPLLADASQNDVNVIVQQDSRYRLGSEVVAQLRADYEAGVYDEFLSDMDRAYQQANDDEQLEGLVEIRKTNGEYTVSLKELTAGFEQIQAEKNQALLKAAAGDNNSLFAVKIRSVATPLPDAVREATIALSELRHMGPGMGKNNDENQLIAIDLASHYKEIHLDSLAARGQDVENRRDKHLILEMQRMDLMKQASVNFEDKQLKSIIESAVSDNDLRLAKIYDSSDLNDLARGRTTPASAVEERVAGIVADAHAKFADLNRDLLFKSVEPAR